MGWNQIHSRIPHRNLGLFEASPATPWLMGFALCHVPTASRDPTPMILGCSVATCGCASPVGPASLTHELLTPRVSVCVPSNPFTARYSATKSHLIRVVALNNLRSPRCFTYFCRTRSIQIQLGLTSGSETCLLSPPARLLLSLPHEPVLQSRWVSLIGSLAPPQFPAPAGQRGIPFLVAVVAFPHPAVSSCSLGVRRLNRVRPA